MAATWIYVVIDGFLGLSETVQNAIVFIVGAGLAALVNHVTYTHPHLYPRPISPWTEKHPDAPERSVWTRIPMVSYFALRNESGIHGRGFWIRPLLTEWLFPLSLVALFRFELSGGLLPPTLPAIGGFLATYQPFALPMFVTHMVLAAFMLAATWIDFDEWTIPDIITVPGTLLAILASVLSWWIYPPSFVGGGAPLLPTGFDSPWFTHIAPPLPPWRWCWVGVSIWSIWCFALSDRRISIRLMERRGVVGAIKHLCTGIVRGHGFGRLLAMWVLGSVAVIVVAGLGGRPWYGMLTSLIGLAVGGGVVWAIRIVAGVALNQEAMGFGDVTLMAMIGAAIGWQAAVIAFFLSPFTAIVIVLVRRIVSGESHTPFGPYLCAGTVLTVLFWDAAYNERFAPQLLLLGDFLLMLAAVMLVLMAMMLIVWRFIKQRVFVIEDSN